MEDNIKHELEQLRLENEALRNKVNDTSHKQERKKEKKKKGLAWTWKLFAGQSLNKSFNNWFREFHSDTKVSPDTSANLLTSIVRRFVRVKTLSLVLLLFSLVPSLITLWVLVKQNTLITTQNSLVEASRKSSYGFQLTNIFDAVDKNGYSESIKARIIGLSHSLKPYKQLKEDGEAQGELSNKMYSPERSQLLLFLVNSSISNTNLSKIFESANFSYCDLNGMDFSRKYLANANLAYSNLEGANFNKANLINASLTNANLTGVKFSEVIAKKTNFKNANLTGADMRYADLTGATLIETNLSKANLNFGILKNSCLTDAIMKNTNFNKANLSNAYYKGSFKLNVDSKNQQNGNVSESYIATEYSTKEDNDGFDTFIKK